MEETIMIQSRKKELFMEAVSVSFIVLLAFLFALQASNDIWRKGNTGTDSSVFKYVARVILSGGMPYKDTFDHKGPLIYLINAAGMKIAEWRGVWVFEFFAILLTFYFMYKITRLYVGRGMSIVLLVIASSPLFTYFEGGNLTEEYAMPFIAVSIYIFADYFLNAKVDPIRLAVCGFSFAAILLLRPNMCAVWLVMCIGVLGQCVWTKRQKELLPFIAYFVLGAFVLLIPVILWLAANGALRACIEDYIIFNMQYSADVQAGVANKIDSFIFFLNSSLILFSVCGLFYMCCSKRDYFDILQLIFIGTTLLLICVSGQKYKHYGMVLIPALSYPLARIVGDLRENEPGKKLSSLLVVYLFVSFAASGWLGAVKNAAVEYSGRDELHFGVKEQEVVSMVLNNTSEDDRIIVLGNWDIVYNLSGRFAASRYSYQSPPLKIDTERAEEFYRELQANKPKVIVLPDKAFGSEWVLQYVEEAGYYEIGKTTDQTVTIYGWGE